MKSLTLAALFAWAATIWGCEAQQQGLAGINRLGYSDVEFISSRDTVLTSTINGRIFVEVNGSKQKTLLTELHDEIYDILYSPKNDYIFAATYQSGVIILQKSTGKIVKKLQTPYWCTSLDLNRNENVLVGGCVNGNVYFWDIQKGFARDQLSNRSPAFAVKLYNHDRNLIVAGYTISFWDMDSRKVLKTIHPHSTTIPAVDVDGQSKIMVSCSYDKKALIINLKTYSVQQRLSHPNFPLEVSPGKKVDVPIQLALTSCRIRNHQLVTAGADRTIRIWDIKTGKLLKTFTGHPGAVSNIDLSFDGNQVASVGLRGELRFWNLN